MKWKMTLEHFILTNHVKYIYTENVMIKTFLGWSGTLYIPGTKLKSLCANYDSIDLTN